MIVRRCCQCKSVVNEYTVQEDYSSWCKQCYDEGCNLLFKGQFTEEEVVTRKEYLSKYYEEQRELLRKVFKISKITTHRGQTTYIEDCKARMKILMDSEAIRCKDLKITRSELQKYPERFREISCYSDKELAKLMNVTEYYFNQILRVVKLDWSNGEVDFPTLYRYYNPNIVI